MEVLLQWREMSDEADKGATPATSECLTPWDVQSRRIFDEDGVWPALYGGDGGGHGYVSTAVAYNRRDGMQRSDEAEIAPTTAGGNTVTSTLYAGYGNQWNGNAGAYSGDHFIAQPVAFSCNQRDEVTAV